MKKKLLSLLLSAAALFVTFTACAKDEIVLPQYCTVTFILPDGTEQKVRVEKGGHLNSDQIPTIGEIEGYTGVAKWDRTQFDVIQSDITVNVDKTNLTPIEYTVTYSVEGEVALPEGVESTFKVKYDSTYTLATPVVDEGYYFWYWYSGTEENQKRFGITGTWKTTENVTLFARYEKRPEGKVAVRFEMENGAEPVVEWVEKNGSFNKDLPAVPVIPGYDIAWGKTKEELVNLTQDVVITPVKTPKKYTLTLELNLSGAKIQTTTVEVKYNEIPVIPTPEDPSGEYTFSRWKIKGTNTVFFPNQPYTYTEDITLVAQWDGSWTGFY